MELMPAIVGLFPFFASNLKKLIFMTSSCPFLFERLLSTETVVSRRWGITNLVSNESIRVKFPP